MLEMKGAVPVARMLEAKGETNSVSAHRKRGQSPEPPGSHRTESARREQQD